MWNVIFLFQNYGGKLASTKKIPVKLTGIETFNDYYLVIDNPVLLIGTCCIGYSFSGAIKKDR